MGAGSNVAWTAALLAWVLAVPLWFVSKFLVVIAHEGGHALLMVLFFRSVKSVEIGRDGGGATTPASELPWLADIFATLAGYLGPSMFGLAGVWMLRQGYVEAVLWASMAFLVVMLFAVRGFLGWLLVPGLIVLIWMIATRAEGPVQTLYTHMWVWLLLIGGVQRMLGFVLTRNWTVKGNDTAVLQSRTLIPSEIWSLFFLAGTIAALAYGGGMLLRSAV
ncbi:M50 family metallopeptidase [Actinoplanes sp. NPDC049596]|uniref:M50 family metallopeptidase n=1 Tax=unclassified Actinoplanes TaxID=2626549 RepID=UPI00341637BF